MFGSLGEPLHYPEEGNIQEHKDQEVQELSDRNNQYSQT
jgi:hypothetical protein